MSITSRARVLVTSEVARWPCLRTPFGATAAEIAAAGARREDYSKSLCQAVEAEAHREGFLSALGSVLSKAGDVPTGQQPWDVGYVLRRLRERLGDVDDGKPAVGDRALVCAHCSHDGGITRFGRRYPPERAVLEPRHRIKDMDGRPVRPATQEPLCGWHLELLAWRAYSETKPRLPYPMPAWTGPAPASDDVRRVMARILSLDGKDNPMPMPMEPNPEDVRRGLREAMREPGDESDEVCQQQRESA